MLLADKMTLNEAIETIDGGLNRALLGPDFWEACHFALDVLKALQD